MLREPGLAVVLRRDAVFAGAGPVTAYGGRGSPGASSSSLPDRKP